MISKKIPICIISFNRSLYLNSLLFSLENELNDFEIVVVDNGSKETLMSSLKHEWKNKITWLQLPGGDWINDEYKAKNAFIKFCKDNNSNRFNLEDVIFLQDDLQYVGPKGHLKNIINDISKNNCILTGITGVRQSTILSTYDKNKVNDIWPIRDRHFGTTGCYKFFVFDEIGEYSQSYPLDKSYWGRGEDDYHQRVMNKFHNSDWVISSTMHVPIFIGVWNDPRGHYSFIRNNKRFGHYIPPKGKTYYENLSFDEWTNLKSRTMPSGFKDLAKPIGWNYAKDSLGDQLKYPQAKIIEEGPISEIF
jgi:hypothetical protein